MTRWRTIALLSLLAALAACNKDKAAEPPAELVDVKQTLPVERLWSTSVGSGGERLRLALGLAAGDGVLYAASRKGEVHALDASSGRTRWVSDTKAELAAGPSTGEGLVVVGTSSGTVIALEAVDGKERWRARLSGEVLSAPLVAEGRVMVRTVDGRLRALEAADGKEAWMVEDLVPRLTLRGASPPAQAGDAVISGFDTGRVMAVAIPTGDILWQAQVSTPRGRSELERLADIDAGVRVAGDEVYAVGYQGRIAMIARDSGQIWWTRDLSSYRDIGMDEGQLYVATSDGDVVAMRRRDGGVAWQQTGLKRRGLGAPVLHGGAVVVGDFDGYLHWLDRETGRFVARERPGRTRFATTPIVIGDRLFVIDDGGEITAFRAGAGSGR
jgi:outer membrane protein assembly factor BamB